MKGRTMGPGVEFSCTMVYSPNCCNSQGWLSLKPGAQNSISVSTWVVGAQRPRPSSVAFSGAVTGSQTGSGASGTRIDVLIENLSHVGDNFVCFSIILALSYPLFNFLFCYTFFMFVSQMLIIIIMIFTNLSCFSIYAHKVGLPFGN